MGASSATFESGRGHPGGKPRPPRHKQKGRPAGRLLSHIPAGRTTARTSCRRTMSCRAKIRCRRKGYCRTVKTLRCHCWRHGYTHGRGLRRTRRQDRGRPPSVRGFHPETVGSRNCCIGDGLQCCYRSRPDTATSTRPHCWSRRARRQDWALRPVSAGWEHRQCGCARQGAAGGGVEDLFGHGKT